MGSEDPIVSLEDVVIGYETESPLVSIPNLEIFSGEIVAIAGPSGIGKSTLLGTIAGLIPPISGSIKVCGTEIPSKPLRGSLGYIPQKLGLVRHASVRHNVMLGARAGTNHRKERWERVTDAIQQMGLEEKSREPIRRLSGGQQRRVATARTLAQRPRLILADEFLSELDEETLTVVLESVTSYVRRNNSALIVVEHDISRARSMANRLLVIDDGRVNPFINKPKAVVLNS